MTWRERIQAAKERGTFTQEDKALAKDAKTCMCGELATRFGVDRIKLGTSRYLSLYGDAVMWGVFPIYVDANKFFAAEHLLDAAEDRALQLKREQAAP